MNEMELNGKSKDIVSDNISKIKEIFPDIFTEDKIDFDKLKNELGDYVDDAHEKYSFTWPGKTQAIKESQKQSTGTLRPCKEESKHWDKTQNLYIEGDNLEVLKLLQKSYYNKVKMIFIDPPYNTGKDFIYSDNYQDNLENYLKISGQLVESEEDNVGIKITTNPETAGRYHSNWLNMMYPRLKLARNLLTDDGVIFISIDDSEAENLKRICDEIFGEENYVETIYIQVRYANKSLNEKNDFQKLIERVLIYKKREFHAVKDSKDYPIEKFCYQINEKSEGRKEQIGNRNVTIFEKDEYEIIKVEPHIDGLKETWASGSVLKGNASGKYFDKYLSPRTKVDGLNILYKVEGIGEDGLGFRYFTGPKREGATKGKFYSKVPLVKREKILSGEAKKYSPIVNFADFSPDFGNIRSEGGVNFRAGKKPVKYLRKFIDMVPGNDFIVLDFFSGSASTAHAVINKNSEDKAHRKFIMVQLPEIIDETSDYYREGYRTICDIGKTRITNVINEYKDSESSIDLGFKVFKLDSSNLEKWEPDYNNIQQSLTINNVKEDRTNEDLVYEIMLKYGIDLTLPIEKHENIYSIGFGALVICLDNNITKEITDKILKFTNKASTSRVVFKDSGFASDADKTNIKEILKINKIDEFITI